MKDELLEIDIRLLIVRYGRQRVLDVLAKLIEITPEQLEQQLRTLELKPRRDRSKRPKPSTIDVALSESRERSDIAEPLRSLAIAFENRTFLPHLRDAQRFLDRIGASVHKLKSRAVAGPALIRALSKLPRDELLALVARDASPGESDYSLLSRAIMGTQSNPRNQK